MHPLEFPTSFGFTPTIHSFINEFTSTIYILSFTCYTFGINCLVPSRPFQQ